MCDDAYTGAQETIEAISLAGYALLPECLDRHTLGLVADLAGLTLCDVATAHALLHGLARGAFKDVGTDPLAFRQKLLETCASATQHPKKTSAPPPRSGKPRLVCVK